MASSVFPLAQRAFLPLQNARAVYLREGRKTYLRGRTNSRKTRTRTLETWNGVAHDPPRPAIWTLYEPWRQLFSFSDMDRRFLSSTKPSRSEEMLHHALRMPMPKLVPSMVRTRCLHINRELAAFDASRGRGLLHSGLLFHPL